MIRALCIVALLGLAACRVDVYIDGDDDTAGLDAGRAGDASPPDAAPPPDAGFEGPDAQAITDAAPGCDGPCSQDAL